MKRFICLIVSVIFIIGNSAVVSMPGSDTYRYAVVISNSAYSDAGWKAVADALITKHGTLGSLGAKLFKWSSNVNEVKNDLSSFKPDYIGYVAIPATECNSNFVHAVHKLSRELDSDIYADAVYGIITGYEASDAMRAINDSVLVETAVIAHSGQDFGKFHSTSKYKGFRHFKQAFYSSEGNGKQGYPASQYCFSDGTEYFENKVLINKEGETDKAIIYPNIFNSGKIDITVPSQGKIEGTPDFFSTSGHGNINSWQIQFSGRPSYDGYFRCNAGQLYGSPKSGSRVNINSKKPVIYFATGNCLIGKPDNINNMVYAWFHTGRAVNMFGYIIPSSYGYMGWGCYERFVHFPGKNNPGETFFITNQCYLYDLEARNHSNTQFRDNTMLYGDPKAKAYSHSFGDSAHIFMQHLNRIKANGANAPDTFVYTMTPHHFDLDGKIDEGSNLKVYSAFRPFEFLPVRIDASTINVEKNDGRNAAITDNFVLWDIMSRTGKIQKGTTLVLRWTAKVVEENTPIVNPIINSKHEKPWLHVASSPENSRITLKHRGLPQGIITVRIYNAAGQRLVHTSIANNEKHIDIDLRGDAANNLTSGILYAVVKCGKVTVSDTFTFLR